MDHASTAVSNGPTDFIQKLYRMISDPQSNSFSYWSESGNTFLIQDPHDFAKLLLPRHFKHNNFQSFIRQLNKYGFSKVKRNSEDKRWEFKHENFTRDGYDTLKEIKRKAASTKRVSVNSIENRVPEHLKEAISSLKNNSSIDEDFLKTYIVKIDKLKKREILTELKLQRNLDLLLNNVSNLHKAMQAQDELMQTVIQCIISQEKALMLFLDNQTKTDAKDPHSIISSSSLPNSSNIQRLVTTYKQVSKVSGEFLDNFSKTINDIQNSNSNSNELFQSLNEIPIIKTDNHLTRCDGNLIIKRSSSEALKDSIKQRINRTTKNNDISNHLKLKTHALRKRSRNEDLKWTWIVPPNVLLVDDDPTCQTIYSRSLQVLGCSYEIAVDGIEAVKKMQSRKYDMVLMDIWMPEMDGLSATKRIREFDHNTPIIAITSDYREADREFYLSQGINEVLGKPLKVNELGPIMQKHWLKFCISRDAEPHLSTDIQNYPIQANNSHAFAPSLAHTFQQPSPATL